MGTFNVIFIACSIAGQPGCAGKGHHFAQKGTTGLCASQVFFFSRLRICIRFGDLLGYLCRDVPRLDLDTLLAPIGLDAGDLDFDKSASETVPTTFQQPLLRGFQV